MRIVRALCAVLVAALMVAASPAVTVGQERPAALPSGGDATIYIGTYDEKILVVDEATMVARDTIDVTVGIPMMMLLSPDRSRFYVADPTFEQIEVIDRATRRPIDRFTLNSGNTRVRISGFNVDPLNRFAVMVIKKYTKLPDRFEISAPALVRYDLATKTVTDTIPWPRGEERDGAQIIFSPAGDLLYFFTTDDVLVYSTDSLKQVDRWDLSRTLFEEGLGRLNFFFPNDLNEEPGFYTGLFRVSDAVNRRALMGIARVDLVNRSVDFYSLGPSAPVSFRLAPGRQRGYGLRQEVGNYQFWTFDLASRRVVNRHEFHGRPRMGLTVSSNGNLLYIHSAGNTVDVYDANTFAYHGQVELAADMTSFVLVPPR